MRLEIREGGDAAPSAGDLPLYCAWRRSGCYMHNNVVEVFRVVARRTRRVAGDSRVYKVGGPRKKPHSIHKVDGVWRHDMGTPDLFVAYGDTEGEALAALRGQVAAKAARLRHRASLYDAFAVTCEGAECARA